MGNPLRIPMQYCESIRKLFSFTEMSCSKVALVFIKRARDNSEAFRRSFSRRTDSLISLTSRCNLETDGKNWNDNDTPYLVL